MTKSSSLKGSDTIVGGTIIMPIAMSAALTSMSSTRNDEDDQVNMTVRTRLYRASAGQARSRPDPRVKTVTDERHGHPASRRDGRAEAAEQHRLPGLRAARDQDVVGLQHELADAHRQSKTYGHDGGLCVG